MYAHDRDRTCDRWLIRPMLYRLSYASLYYYYYILLLYYYMEIPGIDPESYTCKAYVLPFELYPLHIISYMIIIIITTTNTYIISHTCLPGESQLS